MRLEMRAESECKVFSRGATGERVVTGFAATARLESNSPSLQEGAQSQSFIEFYSTS